MARVYVGTYAKYNAGNLHGAWLDLEAYADSEEFHEAARALHADESDPELMFQGWEDIPAGYIHESSIEPELWDWLELDDHDREVFQAYRDSVDQTASIESALEAYAGTYEDRGDYAYQSHKDSGSFDPDSLPSNYIDWDHVGRDMEYGGMHFVEVSHKRCFVFHNQ